MNGVPVVKCSHLTKCYEQGELTVRALNDISITLCEGDFASLSGPSGSGKSTLLNLIGGLDQATQGTVEIAGTELGTCSNGELAQLRLDSIGFVFQAYNLIPVLSARENVEFVMQLQGVASSERRDRALEMLELVGLGGMSERRPHQLSGGQQQRVAVARAIVTTPRIVLADEPTANLDSKTATSLLDLMRGMNEERRATFLFSTHDPLVMSYARRVVTLSDGAIVADEQKG